MRRMRDYLKIGGLAVGIGILAACGPTTMATNTVAPATTAVTTRAAATPATPTRAVTPAGTPTRTPGTPGTVGIGAVLPAQAYQNLQQLDSYRQSWRFTGFTFAGLSGELTPVFEYNGTNAKVTAMSAGQTINAYRVGGNIYVPNPLGGFIQADQSNPLAAPAQALFETPSIVLTNLIPGTATYTPAGTETVNGRQATKYTANVPVADLGFVNPALQGRRGTAATQVWVDNERGYIVALEADIQTDDPGTSAKTRMDVTDVGQIPPINVP